jgi:hypothetical protein
MGRRTPRVLTVSCKTTMAAGGTGVEAGNDATFAGATAPTPAGDRGIFVLALSALGARPKATEDPADGCVFGT